MSKYFKEDFLAWRSHEMTQELHNSIKEQIGACASELMGRDEPNANRDMLIRGVAKAMLSVLEWEPEFIEETQVEENDDDEV